MFEIVQTGRDRSNRKLLASTPYSDVARVVGRAMAEHYWPARSRFEHEALEEGEGYIEIMSDGVLWATVVVRKPETFEWRAELT